MTSKQERDTLQGQRDSCQIKERNKTKGRLTVHKNINELTIFLPSS